VGGKKISEIFVVTTFAGITVNDQPVKTLKT
jgi:hypothetical protein